MFVGAIAGIVLSLGVFAAVAWQRMDQFGSRFSAGRSSPQSSIATAPESSVAKTGAETDADPVYRYSVIPGGVRTPEELLAAMANDSVVAGHYAGLDKTKLTSGRLNEPLKAHVSYRIGDRVYWTKRKVTLEAGEQVLTDGQTLVRARCGNNVSVDPLLPTLDNEPKPEAFDAIVPPGANTLVQLDPAHSYFTPNDLKTPQAGSGQAPFGRSSIGGVGGPIPAGNSGTSGASPNTQSGDAPPNGVPPGGTPPGDPPGNPPCVPPASAISAQGVSSADGPSCNGSSGDPPGGDPPGGNPPGGNPKGDPPNDIPPNDVPNAPTPVPEPGTLLLVGAGAAALLAHRIRKQKRA